MKRKLSKSGFTLVELIIVIAIIGVLSVSAFTIVTKWLGKSRDSRRLGEINQISKGLQSYQIENGKYPMPDMNYITLTSGIDTIGYQGYVGSGVSRIIELNKITKDPMDEKYYTYTTNLSKYQLMAMLEGSGSVNLGYRGKEQGESKKEYAINVIAREGNDRGDLKIASQELISENGSQGQLIFNSVYAATDYSKRYPYLIGDKLGVILANTGGNTNAPVQELYNDTTFTGINLPSIDTGSYTSYVDNTTILNGTGLLQMPIYTNQSVVTPTTQESGGGGSSQANSCASTAWVSNATYLTGSPTTTNQAWQNTNSSNPCYYACTNGYSGNDCSVPPVTGWRVLDSNCDINDIVVGGQTWAGCNSTLGNGFEWGQTDANIGTTNYNGTLSSCYPAYNGTNNTSNCTFGSVAMRSNTKANIWFTTTNVNGDGEFPAIWGKLYTWANASSACPSGRHVPTDAEWTILENTLAGSSCRTGDGWQCDGLGWKNNGTNTRKLADILKLPLAGYRNADGSSFDGRGYSAHLWASTEYGSTLARGRYLHRNYSTVYRVYRDKARGFSVRCIKD